MIAGGDAFERVTGFEIRAAAEEAACGNDLDDRRRQGERAGAGDDQGGYGYQDGFAQAEPRQPPAKERKQRRRVDDRHVERHGLVGDAAVGAALLLARFEHSSDVGQKRVRRGGRRAAGERLGQVDGSRHQLHAGGGKARQAFAGDEALVDFGLAMLDQHVDNGAFAGSEQDAVTRTDVFSADGFMGACGVYARDGAAGERCEVARGGVGAAADAGIEEAADEQEEEQHAGGVEIGMLAAADGFGDTDAESEDQGQGDRHIHVGAAAFQHVPGRPEEGTPGEKERRQRDETRNSVQALACRFAHLAIAAPDRNGEEHDVGGRKAGHAHGEQQGLLFLLVLGVSGARIERGDAVAKIADRARDALG